MLKQNITNLSAIFWILALSTPTCIHDKIDSLTYVQFYSFICLTAFTMMVLCYGSFIIWALAKTITFTPASELGPGK